MATAHLESLVVNNSLPIHVDTTGYLVEMHSLFYLCIFVDTSSKWSLGGMDACRCLMTMNPVCCPCVPILVDTYMIYIYSESGYSGAWLKRIQRGRAETDTAVQD